MSDYEIMQGDPEIRITYTATDGPSAGVEIAGGTLWEHPEQGLLVKFGYYGLPKAVQKKLRKGSSLCLKVSTRPDLAALVAAARTALAEAEARFAAEAAALEPIGFEVVYGCDTADTYRYLWPDGTDWDLHEERLKRAGPSQRELPTPDAIRARLKTEDWKRIAAETAAAPAPGGYTSYGGYRFGAAGLAAILALHADRKAEADTARARKAAERDAKTTASLAEAKATGKPVELARWTEECDGADGVDECSLDVCRRLAMPDGSIRVSRQHTF
jgi:hypothetical protein